MGWIALSALFFGAPLFYWWLSRNDDELVREIVENLAASRVADKNKRLAEKEKNLNQIIESNKAALNAKVRDLEKAQELLIAENQSLKAKLEFAPDVPRPSESIKKSSGVLDQDIF
jgi:DNA-binding transcriptional regulator GbsR (MarR family)